MVTSRMQSDNNFLNRLIERLDKLDSSSLQTYVLRLLREKGFLETVFNTIHEGIVVLDRELHVHYANAAAFSLLGLPDNFVGQRIDRFLRDVDWSRLMFADPDEWHRVSFQEIEVFYPEHRFLNFYLVPLEAEHSTSEIPLVTMIIHDVTALQKNTEEAIESQKIQAITMLARGVAHEIGNPLNSLNIHLQLLERRLQEAEDADFVAEATELLRVSKQEVERLDGIVNQFLRAIRPPEPQLERIDVKEVLSEALKFMHQEIEDKSIEVEARWPDRVSAINGDPNLLKQAFYNIIKNAVQAMPDGGILRIICDETDYEILLRFNDTGKGISRSDMTKIMEAYYTTRSEGSGLGLWIVDQIVRSHGGEIGIDSEPGVGTSFTISLPLHERKMRLLKSPRTETESEEEYDAAAEERSERTADDNTE